MRRGEPVAAALAALLLALAGCTGASEDAGPAPSAAPPEPSISLVPLPEDPPSGVVEADLRQSSRDAARGRVQVWLDNGTGEDLVPTRLTYRDARLSRPVAGERLRDLPDGTERGFPLTLPPARCPVPSGSAARVVPPLVVVELAGEVLRLEVSDEADVLDRYADRACTAQALDRVVAARFLDRVPLSAGSPEGEGQAGELLLRLTPRPGAEGSVLLREVRGTPVLSSVGGPVWRPGVRLAGGDRPVVVRLPVRPARCDGHAFAEAAGATAFRLGVVVREGGRRTVGELELRMSDAGARAALDLALTSCGLGG